MKKDSKEQCLVDLDFQGITNQILFLVKIGELGGAGKRAKELGISKKSRTIAGSDERATSQVSLSTS